MRRSQARCSHTRASATRQYNLVPTKGVDALRLVCLCILCYRTFHPSKTNVRKLNVYWNSVYRKIFSYKLWESVREVMIHLHKKNFEYIYYERKLFPA